MKISARGSSAVFVAPAIAAIAISVGAAGCAGSPAKPIAPAPAAATAAKATPPAEDRGAAPAAVEDREQREAQRAWCSYLQALYLRASDGEKSWPKFRQCTEIMTPAAPAMLRQTSDCAMRALQEFKGDPFTPAYAAEVSRCGTETIEALAAKPAEVAPFIDLICERAAACGETDPQACHASLESHVGPSLRRAIGAINTRGRNELRACLRSAGCKDLGEEISGCLEPIMDRLLWLPPG